VPHRAGVVDGGGLLFESDLDPSAAAVASAFPDGTYTFVIDGNASSISGTLRYARSPTAGLISIDASANGATVDPFPVFTVTNQCTNCAAYLAQIEDLDTGGADVSRSLPS
jgi:hypothetical protein